MSTRRLLWLLVAGLSLVIVVGGGGVAVLGWLLVSGKQSQAVLVGADRQLRLLPGRGPERVLASDVSDELFRYPSVSPDGRSVAYISSDEEGFALWSLDLASGDRRELYSSVRNPPLYLSWAPDSSQISFLTNRWEGGLGIHVVAADGSAPADEVGTTLGTSYFAWTSDSSTLLLHTGSSAVQPGQISTYRPGGSPRALRDDPGLFQAPAWSVSGEAFFYVAQPPVAGALTLDAVESVLSRAPAAGGQPQALVSEPRAAIFFSRAPSSDHLAYTTVTAEGYGALKLVSPDGGAVATLSRPGEQVQAFFWAPDGRQIAYLTGAPGPDGQPRYTWHLADARGGDVRDLGSFAPSRAFAAMLTYFDAYALSVQLWSPDSGELIYGAADGVYILNVASGQARRAGDGVLGMWAQAR